MCVCVCVCVCVCEESNRLMWGKFVNSRPRGKKRIFRIKHHIQNRIKFLRSNQAVKLRFPKKHH